MDAQTHRQKYMPKQSLEEQLEQRKERLAALKQRAQGSAAGSAGHNGAAAATAKRSRDTEDTDADHESDKAPLRFRNYEPANDQLKDFVKPAPLVGPQAKDYVDTVEGQVEEMKRKTLEAEENRSKELDLENLAPKKPNWDLKRDLDKKMEKLARKTQAAITDLIRQRLKASQDLSLISQAGDTAGHNTAEDDDEE